jgi:hypothetical protein
MSNSEMSSSTEVNLTTNQLRELFWRNRIMEQFRQGWGISFIIEVGIIPTSEEFTSWLFTDDPLVQLKTKHRHYTFSYQGAYYGVEQWLAVTCDDVVIVPPFRMTIRQDLPYFPEEMEQCSPFR